MMIARIIVSAVFLTFVASAFATEPSDKQQSTGTQNDGLAKKLVDGSPWRFTTKYEDTIYHFRLTGDGKLQRRSDKNLADWKDFEVSNAQTATYTTINGHVITYSLGADGSPTANHSKHSSQFKSIKE